MIDEEKFIEWFDNQNYWHLSCDCDNGQHYCGIDYCINDFKIDNDFKKEIKKYIHQEIGIYFRDKLSIEDFEENLFNRLKQEGAFD